MAVGGGGGAGRWLCGVAIASAISLSACSARKPTTVVYPPPPPAIPGETVDGVASWYGPGFNGHRTADGEVYNQEDMTAASNIFPIGTRLMVTNLKNQRSAEVRINDRGPFVKGRKIDLSHAAARVLGIVKPGTAQVQMTVLSTPPGTELAAGGVRYFVQVGSFQNPSNAAALRNRLVHYVPDIQIDTLDAGQHRYYRVRMGAFPSRDEAQARAADFARLGLPILVVSE